jgi:hypothetical protein
VQVSISNAQSDMMWSGMTQYAYSQYRPSSRKALIQRQAMEASRGSANTLALFFTQKVMR